MAQIQVTASPSPMLRITTFRGVNLSVDPTEIAENETPDMLNCNINDGKPNKRTGYEKAFPTSLGTGRVNGDFLFRRKDGTRVRLLAHGSKLYTWSKGVQPTEIYNGLADHLVTFFVMNDKCYLMDGTNYLVYDGTTVAPVTPYIPTLTVSTPPTGGGTTLEDFNLLGAGFKQTFSGNGTDKVYQLALTSLDSTPVIVKVGGATKTLTADYTVDFATGKVTFITAPINGTNNVEITAYKTQAGYPDHIKKCTMVVLFGGTNDTRPFVSGNPDFKNYVWRLGLYDPTYAPENGFYKVGSDTEKVQGFSKQYDYLVIEKERSKWNMQYQLVSGVATFPVKPINDTVGTIAPGSIQSIENNPVSLDKTGVYILQASNVRDERNVVHLSVNVDPKLLKESNLEKAVSIDYGRKYWLALNGNVYIFDYALKEWYIYDNIPASLFSEVDSDLYFGGDGMMYRVMKVDDTLPYNDDGTPIKAYWKSKYFDFGADERKKIIDKIFFTLKPNSKTSTDLSVSTNKREADLQVQKNVRVDFFDFWNFDFGHFSLVSSTFPQEFMAKVKLKKITHAQVILQNELLNESLGIVAVTIKFRYQSYVK